MDWQFCRRNTSWRL